MTDYFYVGVDVGQGEVFFCLQHLDTFFLDKSFDELGKGYALSG